MIYAYARVSAKDQNLERQLASFYEFGIEKRCIFSDKKSGKDFERKAYRRLLKKLRAGDLLVVKSIDRLGRNYSQIIEEWNRITNVVGADVLVLDMPLLDTRTKADTLVGKFISDIVLQVLSFVAENERENIRTRQAEGIKIAKEKGVRFGRPSFVYTDKFLSVANDYLCKRIKLKTALKLVNINQSNFYYHIRKIKSSNYNHNPKP
ncbi:MAG: recombinase family protein [Christensenellaceae bacterium]